MKTFKSPNPQKLYRRPSDALFEFWYRIETTVWVLLAFLILFALCAALLVGIFYLIGPPECGAATANIGYPHHWSLWGGCQIEVSEGQWIPLDNYRWTEGK